MPTKVGQVQNASTKIYRQGMNMSRPSALETALKEKIGSALHAAHNLDRLVLILFIVSLFPLPVGAVLVLILSPINLLLTHSNRMNRENRKYILISITFSATYILLFFLVIFHLVVNGKIVSIFEVIYEMFRWPLTGLKVLIHYVSELAQSKII